MLYELVRDYAETLFAEARDRSGGGYGYPAHVENEVRRYIECGVLGRGFVRVHCDGCGRDELVAFSCKGSALCPSCVGRRMSDTAARLVDTTPEDFDRIMQVNVYGVFHVLQRVLRHMQERRSGKVVDGQPAFDGAAAPLPGFELPAEFVL